MPVKAFLRVLFFSLLMTGPALYASGKQVSTEDFRLRPVEDDVFYFILLDRFANGDLLNDKGFDKRRHDQKDSRQDILRHGYWPEHKGFYQGGDFKGVTQKLDYLQNLGVTAIWLSPVMKNLPVQGIGELEQHSAGYHGYWVLDFTSVDPHFGTEDDFKELVDAAHKRGIKVFLDIIGNHTADIISYRECDNCPYRSREEFPYSGKRKGKQLNPGFIDGDPSEANFARLTDPNYAYTPYIRSKPGAIKKPAWLNELIYYHNRGNTSFSGESSELGDFYGLDDLFTEHPRVVQGMIEIYKEWIRKFRIDGFRVDTVKHVNIEFWQHFVPAIRSYAKELGIPNFFVFGEVFSGDPKQLSYYIREGQMDSVLDFGFHGATKTVFADAGSSQAFAQTFAMDDIYRSSSSPQKLMTFISNHDIGRIGHFIQLAQAELSDKQHLQLSKLAHAKLIFARGIPVIYYGDEQGFTGQGGDKLARQSMFPSKVPEYKDNKLIGSSKTPANDNFDIDHPLYQAIREYTAIYHQHKLLRRGEQYPYSAFQAEHAYAFIRALPNHKEDYLLVFNWGQDSVNVPWQRPKAEVIYPKNLALKKGQLELPGMSFAILKGQKVAPQLAARSAPRIIQPAEGERLGDLFIFEVEADAPYEQYPIVDFFYKLSGDTQLYSLPRDYNPPYRAYIDGNTLPQGQSLTLIAEVKQAGQSKPLRLERNVIVDAREALVRVHYENGNQRSHALHLSSNGEVSIFKKLSKEGVYEFSWGKNTRQVLMVYGDSNYEQDSASLKNYDRPFILDYQSIASAIKVEAENLVADIYVNNLQQVSTKPLAKTAKKPPVIPNLRQNKLTSFDRPLYLRGGMNTWQATNTLHPKAPFTYSTTVNLHAGRIEFKIADEYWSAQYNFGAPVQPTGLTSSAQSSNLSIFIPQGHEGKYRFDFVHIPKEVLQAKQDLSFLKVQAM